MAALRLWVQEYFTGFPNESYAGHDIRHPGDEEPARHLLLPLEITLFSFSDCRTANQNQHATYQQHSLHRRFLSLYRRFFLIIAGAASTTGESHILLQLSELNLLDCVTSRHAIQEAERNLSIKLPKALPDFRLILQAAVHIVPDLHALLVRKIIGQAYLKDLPVLAAAISARADFLMTFNTRHFRPRKFPPAVLKPKDLLPRIRASLYRVLE